MITFIDYPGSDESIFYISINERSAIICLEIEVNENKIADRLIFFATITEETRDYLSDWGFVVNEAQGCSRA